MRRIHTLLVTTYLIAGIALMAHAVTTHVQGNILNSGGATLAVQTSDGSPLHGAADKEALMQGAIDAARRATAANQLMLGVLLFTLGGFLHAYQVVRDERPVHITVKKRKPELLYWLEMKI